MRGNVIMNFTAHRTPKSELILLGNNLREINYPLHLDTRMPLKPQVRKAIEYATRIAGIGPEGWYGIVPVSHPPGAFALGEILEGKVPLLCGRGDRDGNWRIQNMEGRADEEA